MFNSEIWPGPCNQIIDANISITGISITASFSYTSTIFEQVNVYIANPSPSWDVYVASCTTVETISTNASYNGSRKPYSPSGFLDTSLFDISKQGCCGDCGSYNWYHYDTGFMGTASSTDHIVVTHNNGGQSSYQACTDSNTTTTNNSPVLDYNIIFRNITGCEVNLEVEFPTIFSGTFSTNWIPLSSLIGTHTITVPEIVSTTGGSPPPTGMILPPGNYPWNNGSQPSGGGTQTITTQTSEVTITVDIF